MRRVATFSSPCAYRVEVQGNVPAGWGNRLGAMQVVARTGAAGGRVTTVLQGCVRDQAELSGILNTLYELHLTLLSVTLKDDVPAR